MIKFGITERGDASLDKSWVEKMQSGNIIITKNPILIQKEILENKNKIILHTTITGLGGTKIEKKIKPPIEVIKDVETIIQNGFPAKQIVVRIDPIIMEYANVIIKQFFPKLKILSDLGVTRARYSYLDVYPHVKKRFIEAGINLNSLNYFQSNSVFQQNFANIIESSLKSIGFLEINTCAELVGTKIGCISKTDFKILGFDSNLAEGKSPQRTNCNCCQNKLELLSLQQKCKYGCLYCYWKD